MKNRIAGQMDSPSSSLSLPNPWIVSFLIPVFIFACANFTMFIITSLILGVSAFLFLTHSKHNVHEIDHEFDLQSSDQNDSKEEENVANKDCLNVGSLDSSSESEIIDPFDSDFDGWNCSGRRTDCSDGSISDEESLIEIELRGGHYVGYKDCRNEEEPKLCRRQKSPDSVLWWPEEENMIEIDLTVGSIKC